MNKQRSVVFAAAAIVSLGFLSPIAAQAATIAGDDVIFTYDDTTLFGAGFVVGNSIFFLPTNFKAESNNGLPGSVTETETLNVEVKVKAGSNFVIDGGHLVEKGDYQLQGSNSSVTASGWLNALSLTQGYSDNDFLTLDGPLTTVGALTQWNGEAAVDFDDTAGWGDDTHVVFQIQNVLSATTAENGEFAIIQKKQGQIGVEVMPEVPLPAAAWLFGSALLGLAGFRHRKAK